MRISALEEELKVDHAFPPSSRASADTRYNDQATAASATGIDTQGYDEALIVLGLNTITSPGTLDLLVMDSSVGTTAAGASTITGAAMSQKLFATGQGVFMGRIKTKNVKRYLYVRAIAATASAKEYAVTVILGKAQKLPITPENTTEFTV